MQKTIGILTGGGDAPGLNAVIRATVKTAITTYGMAVIGIEDGYDGLLTRPLRARPLTFDSVRGLLPVGGTILGCSNRLDPTRFTCRWGSTDPHVPDAYDVALDGVRQLGLTALVVLGGDGTLGMAHQLAQRGVPIIGVPKTIDNDVAATDATFGFDTALTTATEAIDRLHSTAESHHRIMVVEVMGRHAGWIALHAGLAGGADVILIPEIPFQLNAIVAKINERCDRGRNFTMIVVAEGAHAVAGQIIYQSSGDPTAPVRLGGIGAWLADQLTQRTPREVRVTVLGHLQRGGGPTPADRILASRFGSAAARLAATGQTGVMVALKGTSITTVPLEAASHAPRLVDPTSELVETVRSLGICLG